MSVRDRGDRDRDRDRSDRERRRSRSPVRKRSSGWDATPNIGISNDANLSPSAPPLVLGPGAGGPPPASGSTGYLLSSPSGPVHPLQGTLALTGQRPIMSRSFGQAPPVLGEDKPGCDFKLGYVSHIFADKGYFLVSSRTNTLILVGKNIFEPAKMMINEPVALRTGIKESKELFGIAPMYRLKSEPQEGVPIPFGEYHGLVKKLRKNGDTFIECIDLKLAYEVSQAFISGQLTRECSLREGDGVCFNVRPNKVGFPQVTKPIWKRSRQGAGQTSGELDAEIHFGWVEDVHDDRCSIHSNEFGIMTALREVVAPEGLKKGDLLSFCTKPDQPEMCLAPVMKFTGHPGKSSWACYGEFIGKLNDDDESKKLMAENKGNYVQCLAVSEKFGRDAAAHFAVTTECTLVAGDTICFNVHVNKKGWPQLTAPIWKIVSPELPSSEWVKCDRIKKDSAHRLPGAGITSAMLPMEWGILLGRNKKARGAAWAGQWKDWQEEWYEKGGHAQYKDDPSGPPGPGQGFQPPPNMPMDPNRGGVGQIL